MKKMGQILFLLGGFFAIGLVIARIIFQSWLPALWVPFGLSIVCFSGAFFLEWRVLLEFLTLRTTKNGMNMGALIAGVLLLLAALNFVAVQNDKKWDWTSEGLNSLSDQSKKVVGNLKSEVEMILLLKGSPEDNQIEYQVGRFASIFTGESKNFKFSSYKALERPDLAAKYGFKSGSFHIVLKQGEKFQKISQPTEEEITRALIKLTREGRKVLYITQGEGEKAYEVADPESFSVLRSDLESSYEIRKLELFKNPVIPSDAAVVVIVGPQSQFLEPSLEAIRNYARRGGKLFIAADPGTASNIAQLTKSLGVEFGNNFVLDPQAQTPGGGMVIALGVEYSSTSDITRPFRGGFLLFPLASAVRRAPDAPAQFSFDDLVKSSEASFAVSELVEKPKAISKGPYTLGISVKGKLAANAAVPEAEIKEFEAVVFGDSDFLSNQLIRNTFHRDLAMNSISSLAKDADLISIRPKAPKATPLNMTGSQLKAILLLFLLPVPILSFGFAAFLWWRRRSA